MDKFKCKYCGEIFSSKQKLAGHVTHCRFNPNYDINLEKCKQNISKSNKNKLNKNNKNNEIRNDIFCQYCNKQCKSLNSLHNHERLCKSNPNRVESPFVKYNESNKNKNNNCIWNKGLTKFNDERVNKQSNTLKNKYETGELISPNKGRKHTDEEKRNLSIKRRNYLLKNPDKVPYLLNHSSKISYPEQYFIDLFLSENIDLKYHKQVGIYQLDFYNDDLMVYVEIDGEQHYQKKSQEKDKIRDKFFENLGWKGMRIRWSEFIKDENKDIYINKIKDLLNF